MNWRVKLVMWLLKPYSHQVEWKPGSIPVIFADVAAINFEELDGVPCWIVPAHRYGGHPMSDSFYTVYAPDEPEKAV